MAGSVDQADGVRPASPTVARTARAGLLWGSVGVLAFSVSLPATRLAIAGGLSASFVGIGRAVVSGLLALATLILMRQRWPAARLLPRLAVVAFCIVLASRC